MSARNGVALWTLIAMVCAAVVASAQSHASGPDRPRYDVRAAVNLSTRSVEMHVLIDLPAGWDSPTLWLYADRLRDLPRSFNELEAERIFPAVTDRGGYEQLTIKVAGCGALTVPASDSKEKIVDRAIRGRDVPVEVCAQADRPLRLEIETVLTLPHRYGSLGIARDVMTLGDPWYPLVLQNADALVPPLADHEVHIAPTASQLVATPSGVTVTDETTPVARGYQRATTHTPIVILPPGRPTVTDNDAGTQLTFVSDAPELQVRSLFNDDASSTLGPFDVDAAGYTHATVRDCISLLRRLGFIATPSDRARVGGMSDSLVVVEVPERQRLAVSLPGMMLVSDHAFRMVPFDRVLRLHAFAIARAAFASLLTPHERFAARLSDAAWASDLDGALFTDRMVLDAALAQSVEDPDAQKIKEEGAADIVKAFAFNRTVDQLLYAPQVAFGAALFQSTEEPDPDRTGADRARNQDPKGRLVLEKLRDRLGATFGEAAANHIAHGVDWRRAAQAASDHDLTYFWTQWIGPHRAVAYRIDDVHSTPTASGARSVIQITRLGDTSVREPVVVEVEDKQGRKVTAVWDADGPHGAVVVDTIDPVAQVRLDPDGRLSQDPTLANEHPRFDDELSHAWKPPLFGGFSVNYSQPEKRFDFDVSFVARRRYDLDGGWAFEASSTERGWGGTAQRVENFGAMRDLNNRFGTITYGVGFLRSPSGFSSDTTPVTQFSLLASIGWDTVIQAIDPMTGYGGTVYLSANLGREDGGSTSPNATAIARGHVFLWESMPTVSVFIAGASLLVGHALDSQLPGLGGRTMLRAYEVDQSLGRADVYGIYEQRFHVLSGTYLNGAYAAWLRGFDLVPWVAGGVSSTAESAVSVTRDGVLAEVGLGFRMLIDWAGIQPGILVLDVGVPLLRPDPYVRDAQGNVLRERQRVGIWFGFQQII